MPSMHATRAPTFEILIRGITLSVVSLVRVRRRARHLCAAKYTSSRISGQAPYDAGAPGARPIDNSPAVILLHPRGVIPSHECLPPGRLFNIPFQRRPQTLGKVA